MAEAEPIAEAEDVGKGHDIPPTKSGQVSLVAKVTEGDMIAEGVKAPNPVDSVHFDHSSIGGEDFVPKISRVGGEDVAVTFDVGSPNLVQLTEVAANLATRGATAAAGTSDPVASATSEELANLDFTHFPEVPPDLGVSQDFYTGMDTTILPDLNVEEYHIEDCFFKRHGDTVSVGLPRELSSPGHLPASTHFNVAGQSSSGEVRHPQSFGHSASLPSVTQASGDMRESSQPSAEVFFLSYWVSAEVTPILVRIQMLHPSTFTAFKVPGKSVQTGLLECFANFIRNLDTKKVLTTSNKFVESVEANLNGFEMIGLDLSWMRDRLQTIDIFREHENNIAIIASLEETIRNFEDTLEQHRQNLDRIKEKDSALVAQLPQDMTLMDSLMKDLI